MAPRWAAAPQGEKLLISQ